MSYCKLKNSWADTEKYKLSCKQDKNTVEEYVAPVTIPLWQWQQYVAAGNNVLLGSGGIIPGSTVQIPFGGGAAVYKGHVRQGYGGF